MQNAATGLLNSIKVFILGVACLITPKAIANWEASGGNQWTVPVGGGFGRVFAISEQRVNATLQAYWNVVKPDGGADWTLRSQFQLLFPK